MPPVTVHVALGGLIGVVLLAEQFDTRAVLVVMVAAGIPDLDVFIGFFMPGAHRAVLHTVLLPTVLGIVFVWDVWLREESYIRTRWGAYGVRIAWVSIVTLTVAHIFLDAFTSGINLFWPLHDRFYMFSGNFALAYHNGFTVEFIEIIELGTTADTHYGTGFDTVGSSGARRFPIATSGEQFVLLVASYAVIARRIVHDQRTGTTAPIAEHVSDD